MEKLELCRCGKKTVNYSIIDVGDEYGKQLVWCGKCGFGAVGESMADGQMKWNKLVSADQRLKKAIKDIESRERVGHFGNGMAKNILEIFIPELKED